jgi:hypothetical protein
VSIGFWLGPPYWIVALLCSLFYAWKARDIFMVEREQESWAYIAHQAWLNFAGAFCGWMALWLEAIRITAYADSDAAPQFGLADAGLGAVAFIGVTGLLPTTVVGFIQGIRDLAGRVAGVGK